MANPKLLLKPSFGYIEEEESEAAEGMTVTADIMQVITGSKLF